MRSAEPGPSLGLVGADGSAPTHRVSAEDRWMGGGRSTTSPEVLMEGGGFVAVPSETREMSPPTREQGTGSKRSRLDEVEQGTRGSSPKCLHRPTTPA